MTAHVEVASDMPASADVVWQAASPNFCGIGGFHPALASCVLSDDLSVRTLTLKGGGVIVEKKTAWDDAARSYSYEITDSPLPVSNYAATFSVADSGSGSTVTWVADFDPVGDEAAARAVIEGIFTSGLDALKGRL